MRPCLGFAAAAENHGKEVSCARGNGLLELSMERENVLIGESEGKLLEE